MQQKSQDQLDQEFVEKIEAAAIKWWSSLSHREHSIICAKPQFASYVNKGEPGIIKMYLSVCCSGRDEHKYMMIKSQNNSTAACQQIKIESPVSGIVHYNSKGERINTNFNNPDIRNEITFSTEKDESKMSRVLIVEGSTIRIEPENETSVLFVTSGSDSASNQLLVSGSEIKIHASGTGGKNDTLINESEKTSDKEIVTREPEQQIIQNLLQAVKSLYYVRSEGQMDHGQIINSIKQAEAYLAQKNKNKK